MVRKGQLEEIFSKALFADEARLYRIFYRDFEKIREVTLPEFLIQSNNFQTIPINRIKKIKKSNTVLFEKNVMVGE
ncbi:MAG: DUF504 domain-containing protein [Nitrosopumilus sp.]|nr:DUF504 domain-containing protein [Nitrosopumilus sp.]MDH5659222.1 DUF504 domain-containing protein [Nitrosopumilus sp.]